MFAFRRPRRDRHRRRLRALRGTATWWGWTADDRMTGSAFDDPTVRWSDFQTAQLGSAITNLRTALVTPNVASRRPSDVFDNLSGTAATYSMHGTKDGAECRLTDHTTPAGTRMTILLVVVSPIVELPLTIVTPLRHRSPGTPPSGTLRVNGETCDPMWCIDTTHPPTRHMFQDDNVQRVLRTLDGRVRSVELGARWLLLRSEDLAPRQLTWLLQTGIGLRDAIPTSFLEEFAARSTTPVRVVDIRNEPGTWLVRPIRSRPGS